MLFGNKMTSTLMFPSIVQSLCLVTVYFRSHPKLTESILTRPGYVCVLPRMHWEHESDVTPSVSLVWTTTKQQTTLTSCRVDGYKWGDRDKRLIEQHWLRPWCYPAHFTKHMPRVFSFQVRSFRGQVRLLPRIRRTQKWNILASVQVFSFSSVEFIDILRSW